MSEEQKTEVPETGEAVETEQVEEPSQAEKSEEPAQAEKSVETEMDEKRLADENRMRGTGKSTPGYIRRYRRNNIIWLLVWVAIGVGVFVTGWLIWHTRANILTVLAVLMVLPGAKRIVALIAAGRKRSIDEARCRRVETAVEPFIYAGDLDIHEYEPEEEEEEEREIEANVIFTDYIFTSTEKVMMLDFMVVTRHGIFILPSSINKDMDYVKKYLDTGIRKWSHAFEIEFVWDDDKLLSKLSRQPSTDPAPLRERREVLAYLKSLAV